MSARLAAIGLLIRIIKNFVDRRALGLFYFAPESPR